MRRKFSIGAGCQLCRILWVRAHRKSCLGWKGDKNPDATEKRVRDPSDNSRQAALSSHLRVGRVCLSGSAPVGPGPDIDIGDTFLHRLQSKSDFTYCVVQSWNREV